MLSRTSPPSSRRHAAIRCATATIRAAFTATIRAALTPPALTSPAPACLRAPHLPLLPLPGRLSTRPTTPSLFPCPQAIFTPRGTLNTALSGGLPPIATKQDIGFTSDWVQRVFEGGDANPDGMDAQMTEAAEWLMVTFGTPRGTQVPPPTTLPKPSATPRNTTAGKQSDDAVLAAAMQAVLATPRGTSHAVDDKPMAGALNKMFKQQV